MAFASSSPGASRPVDRPAGLRPRFGLPVVLLALAAGFWFSIYTAGTIAGFDSVLGLAVTTVPLAVATAYLAYRRDPADSPPRDAFVDGAAGLLCFAVAFWLLYVQPGHDGWDYWAHRLDLVALEIFAVGLAVWIYGLAALWRLRAALLVLVLGSPPVLILVQEQVAPLLAVLTSVVARPVTSLLGVHYLPTDDPASFIGHALSGARFNIVIADVCSGLSAWMSVLLVGVPAALLLGLNLRRTLGWLATGLVLATLGNLVRVIVVLYSAWRWGPEFALSTVHPYLGVALVFLVFAVLFFTVRPLPLPHATWAAPALRTPLLAALLVVTAVAAIGEYGLLPFGRLPAGGSPGADVRTPVEVAPTVAGWSSTVSQEIDWQDLFGPQSHSFLIVYHPADGRQAVTMQLVTTPDQSRLLAYTPEQCGVYHGADVAGQRSVQLGLGQVGYLIDSAQNLAPTRTHEARRLRFDVLYWYVPFKVAGRDWTARVTLIQDADAAPALPAGDNVAPGGPGWDRVDTSLVNLAREMTKVMATHA